jgi:hypothetical protein
MGRKGILKTSNNSSAPAGTAAVAVAPTASAGVSFPYTNYPIAKYPSPPIRKDYRGRKKTVFLLEFFLFLPAIIFFSVVVVPLCVLLLLC